MKCYNIEFDFLGDIVICANNKKEAMEKFFTWTVGTLNEFSDEKLIIIEEDDEQIVLFLVVV